MAAKILLFGGTFDPVHNGHLIIARSVAEYLHIPRVMLIPSAIPPHKCAARASAQQRLDMLHLATAGEELFEVCDLELRRQGPSYTVDTLLELRKQLGEEIQLHWLIGADMLEILHLWHRAQEVVQLAKIVVADRPPLHHRVEMILERMKGHFPPDVIRDLLSAVVPAPLIDISSTQIRARIAEGRSVRYLMPDGSYHYVKDKNLYRFG